MSLIVSDGILVCFDESSFVFRIVVLFTPQLNNKGSTVSRDWKQFKK